MKLETGNIKRVYFVGIGGIGMSALARYFAHKGLLVAGYDSTETALTKKLESEGISIHYSDNILNIPKQFVEHPRQTLVVYTPAIPGNHQELNYFISNGYQVVKRAKALGIIANSQSTAAVAGTHGKTSTSTLLAHLLASTPQGCTAFLGGISKNFNNNLILTDSGANRMVVEADEFDRSFLNLNPQLAIITSIDADHLDIYQSHQKVKDAFKDFVSNLAPAGVLIVKKGLEKIAKDIDNINTYTYSLENNADFFAKNIGHSNGFYKFDLSSPFGQISNISLGVIGRFNVENAVAASAAALVWGIDTDVLVKGLKSFKGIARRFDLRHAGNKTVYIDDYAHHPEEIRVAIESVREIYPNRKITAVFQPHLYTRTRDFAEEFAISLSLADELILLDIYPAREEPIEGITSEIILNKVTCQQKRLCSLNEVAGVINDTEIDVLVTMGAGNIDKITDGITNLVKEREG